jgi:hypothetical protein
MVRHPATIVLAVLALVAGAHHAAAQSSEPYDHAPIRYSSSQPTDAISSLQARIDRGEVTLSHDDRRGYLDALLKELNIPVSSQTLVFSKTSFQRDKIGPTRPRALYFNDDVYVGYVRGSDMLEIAATDPKLGPVFYTLDQSKRDDEAGVIRPQIVRDTDNCMSCHGGSMTRNFPGLLLRSVRPDPDGNPILSAGSNLVTHETPLAQRWGGWYVTGSHGMNQTHLGNLLGQTRDDPTPADPAAGMNVTDLSTRFDTANYLTAHSDIIALMVLEHQVEMHNRLARASYLTQLAVRDEQVLNDALKRESGHRSDSTKSRIKSACEPVVQYMLFSGEAALAEALEGTTSFAADYAARGPRDSAGRSLRDLDLTRRLLKYPCSPLIYSPAFDGLPDEAKQYILYRVLEVLSGEDISSTFAHLSDADRRAILEILVETKPGLPEPWKQAAAEARSSAR